MEFKKYLFFLDYYFALILIGSQLWSGSVCELLPGYKIYTSPSVTVQRGLCVHVPCSFTVPRDVWLSITTTGTWYNFFNNYGLTIAFKNNLIHQSYNGRFFLTGNVYRGDCSYSIEDPLPTDEGIYYFRVEGEGPLKFTYRDIQPYVNVTDLTDKPTISSTRLVDGNEVTLTCTSPGRCWKIRPQITWDWERTMTGIRQEMYNITYGDGSRTFQSNITFTPRKSHNNSTLFCNVTFEGNFSTAEKKTLNVEYPPSMNITLEGADTDDITAVNVKDGDSITMKCIVDSNPEASIIWYKEDMEVQRTISDRTVTLTLSNITPSDAGRYRCSAENEHGAAHRTVEIIYHNGDSNHITQIILATIGTICLLLLALLAFACWRKKQKKLTSAEMEATYTDLRRSDITSIYDQLKPEIPADTNVIGSDEAAANNYENIQKKNVLK
ncbi:sialic acid-binding Ig-like lectin 12 [Bufo gargarizans]|uniref:sialic acid-binding Ig-like lectin 12 n=1 Tax=Bufo gargarizans TaxID=30331 RepID=UPI001CF470AC|nr:sialic acid-binding Ig-like lectin 12 [Bufo gargarizans]XP_044142648.1 sialic acid-binding Ig-like lectin 12 [Bufo gargarizans]